MTKTTNRKTYAGRDALGCYTVNPGHVAPIDGLTEWQNRAADLHKRADSLARSIHARAWRLAATVGIPRDGCCLHNASIDNNMSGWCAGNPERLRVAKLASLMLSDWSAHRIAERISARLYNQLVSEPHNYARAIERERGETFNRHILFARH